MAEAYPSSNPFRRKPPSTTPSIPPETPNTVNHIAYQHSLPLADSTNRIADVQTKKPPKKVRVQSPPPPSPPTPSLPESSLTIGGDIYRNPLSTSLHDDDPFDSTSSEGSEDVEVNRLSQAPLNPFSKTLATMEHAGKDISTPPTNITSPGRASMDVEAFKRLLMTGNAGLGISTPPTASAQHHGLLGDGGSSTDTSSLSRQSLFEPVQETHPESPRTSHEISEPEDDRHKLITELPSATSARKKPPPPSSRHGKLIRVELQDDPPNTSSVTLPSPQPPTPSSIITQQYFTSSPPNRSNSDLNKPLPLAPRRASHESDRESIFDKESAGRTPEPPSPSASIRRKTPPAPPLTRRHSQRVSDSKMVRDSGRLSPKAEEEGVPIITSTITGRPRSDSTKAPPPPPIRRPGSVRYSSHQGPLSSPSSVSLPVLPPPTPPTRGSSRSISGRPPSIISMDLSSNKRLSMAPPPPPHRHGRGSMDDGSRRTSEEIVRRSSESVRTSNVAEDSERPDILADLTKLQREIDALRTQSERVSSS